VKHTTNRWTLFLSTLTNLHKMGGLTYVKVTLYALVHQGRDGSGVGGWGRLQPPYLYAVHGAPQNPPIVFIHG